MDPTSFIGSLISGGASLLGGLGANAANAKQAAQNIQANQQFLFQQQQFNAEQANQTESWNVANMAQAEDYNAAQAGLQRGFQDTEMSKAMAFNWDTMKESENYNAQQAQIQRQYETDMSNTAYQRAVAGMKAAGLNPILSAGTGGATTPSVASPTVSPASISTPSGASGSIGAMSGPQASSGLQSGVMARMSDVFSPAVSNALQAAQIGINLSRNQAEVDNINADTKNKLLGPGGSIFGVPVNVVEGLINKIFGGGSSGSSAISNAGTVVKNLLPPPGPDAASAVRSQMDKLFGPVPDSVRNSALVRPGAVGSAIANQVKEWLSPPTTSLNPGNPGSIGDAGKPTQSSAKSVTGPDLYDWALSRNHLGQASDSGAWPDLRQLPAQ